MALLLGALRTALVEAGASEDKAEKAAEEVAGYENRLTSMEGRLSNIEGRLTLLMAMVGAVLAMVTAVLLKLFH